MLRASTLFSVIVISMIVGLLTTSLVLIAYFYRLENNKNLLLKRLDLNVRSSINLLLAEKQFLNYDEERKVDLYGTDKDSALLKKMHWGLFDVGFIKVFSGKFTKAKCLLYGYSLDEGASSALYMTDGGRPLFLAGETYIGGVCYLPEAGVKKGNVDGKFFNGDTLIDGEIKISTRSLPELNLKQIDAISIFMEAGKINDGGTRYKRSGFEKDSIINSFSDTTLLIYDKEELLISGKYISGNVIICSDKRVIIEATTHLNDVLIFAPYIKVNEGFNGCMQLFAKDTIIIGEKCRLKYPSVMGIIKSDYDARVSLIQVNKESDFAGIIFTTNDSSDTEGTLVSLEKKTHTEGQIYIDGELDIKGYIWGSVMCNGFFFKTERGAYRNHLLDAVIDRRKLSPYFIGSSLIGTTDHKKNAKWLD